MKPLQKTSKHNYTTNTKIASDIKKLRATLYKNVDKLLGKYTAENNEHLDGEQLRILMEENKKLKQELAKIKEENLVLKQSAESQKLVQMNTITSPQKGFFVDNKSKIIKQQNLPVNYDENPWIGATGFTEAKKFCEKQGWVFHSCFKFASLNKTRKCYWLNSGPKNFSEDWDILLNDWIDRCFYILRIPANTFSYDDFKKKKSKDGKEKANIEILRENQKENFTNLDFGQFCKKVINY